MASQAVIEGIETRTVLVAVAAGRARQEELVYRGLVYGVRDVFLGLGSLSLLPPSPPLSLLNIIVVVVFRCFHHVSLSLHGWLTWWLGCWLRSFFTRDL